MTDLGLIGKYRAEIYRKQAILIEIGYFFRKISKSFSNFSAYFAAETKHDIAPVLHI